MNVHVLSASKHTPSSQASLERDADRALYNLEAEQALLGAILVKNEAMDCVSSFLEPQHFFDPLHGRIYQVATELIAAGNVADPITLHGHFVGAGDVGNRSAVKYLGDLVANATGTRNARQYAALIVQLSVERAHVAIGIAIQDGSLSLEDAPEKRARANEDLERSRENLTDLLAFASDATFETTKQLIKGILSSASRAMLLGRWGAGKTFSAIAMAYAIALGNLFMGRKTTKGACLFVPLEGRGGFTKRLTAANREYGDPGKLIGVLKRTGTLGPMPGSDAFAGTIIAAAKALAKDSGEPVGFIYIETLAAALGGANENDAQTMSAVWGQVDRIIEATGATVMIGHHPSKANGKDARGTGDIMGGADDAVRIDHNDEGSPIRELHLVKARDGEAGPVGTFSLKKMELGADGDGDPITTCTFSAGDGRRAPKKPKRPSPGTAAGKALNELEHLMIAEAGIVSRGHDRIPDGVRVIDTEEWRAACRRKQLSANGEYEAEKKAFQRALGDMSRSGLLGQFGQSVWLPGHVSTDNIEDRK
jgi:hypothetical protein